MLRLDYRNDEMSDFCRVHQGYVNSVKVLIFRAFTSAKNRSFLSQCHD